MKRGIFVAALSLFYLFGLQGASTSNRKNIAVVGNFKNMVEVLEQISESAPITAEITSPYSFYNIGEIITFKIEPKSSGYLYIIAREPDDSLHLLYPNGYSPSDRYVKPNETIRIPEDIGGFRFRAVPPAGNTTVYALITKEPVNWDRILAQKSPKGLTFRSIPNSETTAKKLVDELKSDRNIVPEQYDQNGVNGNGDDPRLSSDSQIPLSKVKAAGKITIQVK